MAQLIEFTGSIRHGSRRFDRQLTVTIADGCLRCASDALRGDVAQVIEDASPEVIRWAMKLLVMLENQEARAQSSVPLQRTKRIRHEAARREAPMMRCPECQGITEVYINDCLTTCPRCDGLGAI